jgi:hypothetical protein
MTKRRLFLAASVALAVLLATYLGWPRAAPAVERVALGMSTAEVDDVLGRPPDDIGYPGYGGLELRYWKSSDDLVSVVFKDGRVVHTGRYTKPTWYQRFATSFGRGLDRLLGR